MDLKEGLYSEATLINLIGTEKQKESYNKQGKFAGGLQRKLFLDKLSEYCIFEKGKRKQEFYIKEVYDIPQTSAYRRMNKGIYKFLTPLILNEIKDYTEENKLCDSYLDFAKRIKICNSNYLNIKCHKDAVYKSMGILPVEIKTYFLRVDLQMTEYIERCLNYLKKDGYLDFTPIYIIQTFSLDVKLEGSKISITKIKDKHVASPKEIKLYNNLLNEAKLFAGVSYGNKSWHNNGSKKFKKEFKKLLNENNIDHLVKGYEIWCINPKKCDLIEKASLPETENIKNLNIEFKKILDKNAEERAEKNKTNHTYLDHFKTLTSLTLMQNAGDIKKIIPDWEERLGAITERENSLTVVYSEVREVEEN